MEVPVINRIRDFDINSINDPSFISRPIAVSGIGKLHQAYGFWKWGALLIAFLAYFTNFITRIKILVVRLRKIDVSASLSSSSTTLFDDYDTDSDVSVSSDDEKEEEEDEDDDYDEDCYLFSNRRRIKEDKDDQGQNGNFTCFGDLFTSGVVKLWDHLDIDGDDEDDQQQRNVLSSFLEKCNSSSSSSSQVFFATEKKGVDVVKVKACDPRFRMPALLAEWRQPGKLLGDIIGVDFGGVEKVYVRDDVNGEIAVGDLRKFNGALTESEAESWWDADVVIKA